ncbi:MAG: histidine kinase [Tetrasphaera sp.]
MRSSPAFALPASRLWSLAWLLPIVFVAAGSAGSQPDAGSARAVAGLLGAVAAACLPLAQVRPLVAITLNAVSVGGYFALGYAEGPIFTTLGATAFVAALAGPPRALGRTIAATYPLVIAGLVTRWATTRTDSGWVTATQSVVNLALMALGAAAGLWIRDRAAIRRERAQRAATEEQLRMARDLHDGVGHGLALIAMQAGVALHVLDRDPAGARRSLEAIRETSREALDTLRINLSAMTGDEVQGRRSPGHALADLPTLVGRVRDAGPRVELTIDDDLATRRFTHIPGPVQAAAYLVVQEALTNALKHRSQPTRRWATCASSC